MQHALIVAHPNPKSFTASLAMAYGEAAEGLGHKTIMRDLYGMSFDPCLKADEIPTPAGFSPRADIVGERLMLGDVDVFALFYPFWINAPPAILKGYLERVFGMGFAYGKGSSGDRAAVARPQAHQLHRFRRADRMGDGIWRLESRPRTIRRTFRGGVRPTGGRSCAFRQHRAGYSQ